MTETLIDKIVVIALVIYRGEYCDTVEIPKTISYLAYSFLNAPPSIRATE